MQDTAAEDFNALVAAHPFDKELIETCVAYGLRYQQIPVSLVDQLASRNVSLEVISQECLRQLDAMPSQLFH